MTDNTRDIDDPTTHLMEQLDPEMDREQLIEELMELKALTSGFFESIPGAFLVLDSRWRLVYLNDDAKKMFTDNETSLIGRPLEEISSKIFSHILAPQVIKPLLEGKEKTAAKYSNFLHKWFKISAYKSDSAIFIRLEEVTEEQIKNRLLRLNEFSVNQAKDMVFWIKTGGQIIYANIASCDSLKYSVKELVKMKIPEIDQSLAGHKWAIFVDKMKHSGSRTYESSFQARDGSVIPVEVTCNYLEYFGEEYLMAFARDITERKKTEKALIDSKAEAELYVDLMGHDINNMNQVATGFLEIALDIMQTEGKLDNTNIDLIAKPLEMILNSSRLIENVRKVQREKLGHFKPETVDICQVLKEVKNSYSNVAGRDINIELFQDGECLVVANELLKDIFTNLVGNSIKHSNGPILVSIEIKSVVEGGIAYSRVAVEDNGPGISDDLKNKLLNRLSPENTRARGKGFGLYLIKQLVNDFHGKLWMEDRVPGDYTKGARFVVMIPTVEK